MNDIKSHKRNPIKMHKGKQLQSSQATLKSQSSVLHTKEDHVQRPLDELKVSIKNLRVSGQDRKPYTVAITFFDQLLLKEAIMPIRARDPEEEDPFYNYMIGGTMSFDPSDYPTMCLFADTPLVVRIHPNDQPGSVSCTSCCNVDILPLFQGETEMCVSKRMEPMVEPTARHLKSWHNLPLIKLKIRIVRNHQNKTHHTILDAANIMKLTVIAAYNVIVPYEKALCEYVAASKIRLSNTETSGIELYKHSIPYPKRFSVNGLYPRWESISWGDVFRKCEEKLSFNLDSVQNKDNINLNHYFEHKNQGNTVVWGSFHRSLLLEEDEELLKHQLCRFQWPIEFQVHCSEGGYSFMGFMDLFKLLYPGETAVRLAVPLHWAEAAVMMERCGCEPLLSHEKTPRSTTLHSSAHNPTKDTVGTSGSGITYVTQQTLPTGADADPAFIVVEVKLVRPLLKPVIPPFIPESEIEAMLSEKKDTKRTCTGRGQQNTDWHETVSNAATSLRKLPQFGTTEFCAFNRQLSETRTRVELTSSFWQDAAVYVNNNFVVQDFLQSEETFEEMLMMAHACLVREASRAMLGVEAEPDGTLRAARHARQVQDIPHATDLYLQLVTENQHNPNSWRELATCLMDKDIDLARVCINEALLLDPRHPLTLLSKGSMLYEEDPNSAELFFTAILELYPFWTSGWVIVYAFYTERQEFHVAEALKKCIHQTRANGLAHDVVPQRGWEAELGDWWYPAPLVPVTSLLLEAADLLLRLRGMPLAEACLALSLSSHGESPSQSHLVALSCRLRGDIENALCHVNGALESFGEVTHLRSLQAECYKEIKNHNGAVTAFEKSGNCFNAYGILSSLPCREPQRVRGVLVELLRRQPSAYAWMALADDWLMRQAATGQLEGAGDAEAEVAMSMCAAACAEQALRWDRRCARAWALLARLTRPNARRAHCRAMAIATSVHHKWSDDELPLSGSAQSLCHRLGTALKECRCNLCETSNKFDCAHLELNIVCKGDSRNLALADLHYVFLKGEFIPTNYQRELVSFWYQTSVIRYLRVPMVTFESVCQALRTLITVIDQATRFIKHSREKMIEYLIAAGIVRWMMRVQRMIEKFMYDVPPPDQIVFAPSPQ